MEGCESRGSVFKPARAGSIIEVARIEGKVFKTMKEAEEHGLELAREWVDRHPAVQGSPRVSTELALKPLRKLLLYWSLILIGCTTGEKIVNIREGLSKAEVIETLGSPDGFQRSGEYEALRYSNRLISGWSWDRADYSVILKNDRVVEYGPSPVRQRDPNTLILVPIR